MWYTSLWLTKLNSCFYAHERCLDDACCGGILLPAFKYAGAWHACFSVQQNNIISLCVCFREGSEPQGSDRQPHKSESRSDPEIQTHLFYFFVAQKI